MNNKNFIKLLPVKKRFTLFVLKIIIIGEKESLDFYL